jgi:hypothetical protein
MDRIRMQPLRRDNTIVLQLRDRSDLVNPNPSPLSGEVITPEAETYIIRKAKQLRAKEPIRLAIELPAPAANAVDNVDVGEAIIEHFRNAANMEAVDIRELFRNGWKALLMGLLMLSTCLFLAWFYTDRLPESRIPRILQESLVILGWVSMWRPIEIFLYEWLPLVRRRNLFLRLSDATVTVEHMGHA